MRGSESRGLLKMKRFSSSSFLCLRLERPSKEEKQNQPQTDVKDRHDQSPTPSIRPGKTHPGIAVVVEESGMDQIARINRQIMNLKMKKTNANRKNSSQEAWL